MNKQTGFAGGMALGIGVAVILVAATAGLYFSGFLGTNPAGTDAAAPSEAAPETTADISTSNAGAETQAAEEIADVAASIPSDAPEPPSITTFRLDPDGQMLVAGRAHPVWITKVHLDDDILGTVQMDTNGEFVEFYQVDKSEQPRILTLSMTSPETGDLVVSLDQIIIAPTADLVATAEAQIENDRPQDAIADEAESLAAEEQQTPTTEPDTPQEDETVAQADEQIAAAPDQTSTEPVTPTVLLSDETGVRVLQAPEIASQAPEIGSAVALDAITYSGAGDVQLSGRGRGEGFVTVYLDNAPITSSPIEEDGNWRSELPEIDTGVYTLRIDEVDEDGNVTSRVETPFKREDQDIAAAQANAQNTRVVTVQPGFTLWAISREAYGDGLLYVRVYEANKDRIRNPDLIYPGQVFSVPQ